VAMALVINAHRYVKLTPEGEKVIVFMHEEAPEGATYIGEVQSKSLPDLLSVRKPEIFLFALLLDKIREQDLIS